MLSPTPPFTEGAAYDDPEVTPAARLRYDACLVVRDGTRVKQPIALDRLPAGDFAVAVHCGPYEQFGVTYAAIFAALLDRPLDGARWYPGDPPAREIYRNDPRKTPAAELETEIWMPIVPAC